MSNFGSAISLLRELELDKLGILIPSDHLQLLSAVRILEAAEKIDEDDYFWAGKGSCSRNTIDLLAVIVSTEEVED